MDKAKVTSGIKELKAKGIWRCSDESLPLQLLQCLQCATSARCVLLAHLEAREQEGTHTGSTLVNVQPHEHVPRWHHCPVLWQSLYGCSVGLLIHWNVKPWSPGKETKTSRNSGGLGGHNLWASYLTYKILQVWLLGFSIFFFFFYHTIPSIAEGQSQTSKTYFMQLSLRKYLHEGRYLLTGLQDTFNQSGRQDIRRLSVRALTFQLISRDMKDFITNVHESPYSHFTCTCL